MVKFLSKLYPISNICIEDIKVSNKETQKLCGKFFSPLEIGKKQMYKSLNEIANTTLMAGYDTYKIRNDYGLKKTKNKLKKIFSAHCVDSWVLANSVVGGHTTPDFTGVLYLEKIRFYRRQLYFINTLKGGNRRRFGGTVSFGFIKGSVIYHKKYGYGYVGGTTNNKLNIHSLNTKKRITRSANPKDCIFIAINKFTYEVIKC